jgi:putative protease
MIQVNPTLELLAPAGDMEKLKYALAYGADAVYAGQPMYSLRARENGFNSVQDIADAIAYCHARGRKFYLTSNIYPHNNKIRSFQKSLDEFISLGPDALIMSDPGMIAYVRKNHPNAEIHLSVQANCTNWSTASFWKDIGVSRVILSRELRLREIAEIKAELPDLELETFVHGAICMAYSGRCMLSTYMNQRDANQGMCSNACRYEYTLFEESKQEKYTPVKGKFFLKESQNPESGMMEVDEDEFGTYFMNSRDMCAIELLPELASAGVCSFKIEGRTKSLYYLARVVQSYRKAIDFVLKGQPVADSVIQDVLKTDSRGYMPGFFKPHNLPPQNYESTRVRSLKGYVAAAVRSWDASTSEAVVSVKGQISADRKVEIFSPESSRQTIISKNSLKNQKGLVVETLHSGMENCRIQLEQDPGEYAFLFLEE